MKFRLPLPMSLPLLGCLAFAGFASGSVQAETQTDQVDTILAIFAHSDDEIQASPVLTKYAREGTNVHLVIAMDGQRGGSNNDLEPADLVLRRAVELQCSATALGFETPVNLGYVAGQAYEHIYEIKADIQAIFADIKPDVVMTWGPDGGYGHKDHKLISSIVTDIFQSGSPDGSAWPTSLYYPAFPQDLLRDDFSPTSQYGYTLQALWGTTDYDYLEYVIPFSDEDKAAVKTATSCHTSQWSPETMVDLHAMVEVGDNKMYLRKALHKAQGKTKLD